MVFYLANKAFLVVGRHLANIDNVLRQSPETINKFYSLKIGKLVNKDKYFLKITKQGYIIEEIFFMSLN